MRFVSSSRSRPGWHPWIHWSALGFIGLTALFIPSLRMTERISAGKYPAYRDYQATTSVLLPLPPRGG